MKTIYPMGSIVWAQLKKYRPNELIKCRVEAIQWYQSMHYRKDAFTVSYNLNPIELLNLEHDEDEWVPECHNGVPPMDGMLPSVPFIWGLVG